MLKKLSAFVLSLCLFLGAMPIFSVNAASNQTGKIMSYLAGWEDWTADDIKGNQLTHLYIAFARIGNDFKISDKEERLTVEDKADLPLPDLVSANLISAEKWTEIEKIQKKYPDLKIIIAIGGWAAEGFSDMASSEPTRQIFVDSIIKYVNKHNLDGVDIDWEYPVSGGWGVIKSRPEDKENFTEFIKLLRKRLPAEKEVSICASVNGSFPTDWVDAKEVAANVNSINLMAYDMQGVWHENTDHHTNLYANPNNPFANWGLSSAEAVDRLINAGVPAEKIVLGLATYGREFRGTEPGPNGDGLFQKFNKEDSTSWRGGIVPFEALENYYINKNGFVRYWDSAAKAPYLYNEKDKIFISYEDQESVASKVNYVKTKGLGGVMYWEYSLDLKGKLLNAMHSAMK